MDYLVAPIYFSFYTKNILYTNFKRLHSIPVLTKYWLYSLCCRIPPCHLPNTQSSLYLPFPPQPLASMAAGSNQITRISINEKGRQEGQSQRRSAVRKQRSEWCRNQSRHVAVSGKPGKAGNGLTLKTSRREHRSAYSLILVQ